MARPHWLTKIERAILEAAIADKARPPGRAPVHMLGVRRRFQKADRKIERLIERRWIEKPSGFQQMPAEDHLWIGDGVAMHLNLTCGRALQRRHSTSSTR